MNDIRNVYSQTDLLVSPFTLPVSIILHYSLLFLPQYSSIVRNIASNKSRVYVIRNFITL